MSRHEQLHEQFEIMCALAAAGQIDGVESEELNRHLESCTDCRERVSDFVQISAQALPLHGESYRGRHPTRELTLRFVIRARAESIPLREVEPTRWRQAWWLRPAGWRTVFAAALVAVMLIVGRAAYLELRRHSPAKVASETRSAEQSKPVALPNPAVQAASATVPRPRAAKRPAQAVQKLEMVETSVYHESGDRPEVFFGLKRPASSLFRLEPKQVEALYASNRIPNGLMFLEVGSTTRTHGWIAGSGALGGPVVTTLSGTSVVFGLLRPSGGYFRKNDTLQFFTEGNAFQSSALGFVVDRYSFSAVSTSSADGPTLTQKIDIPNMFRQRERDWRERWLEQMLQRLRTPRNFQNPPDLVSGFGAWVGIDKEKLASEIDWHERWASTSSERLLALRNSSQCSSDPALRLNAWTGIPRPDPSSEIDWSARWLKRNSAELLNAQSAFGCLLAPDHTLQSKVES